MILKYINSLASNVLISGANDENFNDFETTGKYVLLGNKLFLNTNEDKNIDLKDGLYIYYDPNRDYDTKENKTTIRLFTYSHDAGVKNKIDFKLTGQIQHCGKLDLLKYINFWSYLAHMCNKAFRKKIQQSYLIKLC